MTYLTTWLLRNHEPIPQYAEHETEQAAEAHKAELLASRRATEAVVFWVGDEGSAA